MTPGDQYRSKAAEFDAKARQETNLSRRSEFEHLARAYLRLAKQAERNAGNDLVYGSILPTRSEGNEPDEN